MNKLPPELLNKSLTRDDFGHKVNDGKTHGLKTADHASQKAKFDVSDNRFKEPRCEDVFEGSQSDYADGLGDSPPTAKPIAKGLARVEEQK